MSKTDSTVSYATISDAVDHIQQCSPKAFLAKSDIADAFRLIPLHPSHAVSPYWFQMEE